MLATAPRGKGSQADLATMKSDLDAASSSLQEADSSLAAGNLADVRNKAQSAMQAATQVKSAVEQAMAARKVRRRA